MNMIGDDDGSSHYPGVKRKAEATASVESLAQNTLWMPDENFPTLSHDYLRRVATHPALAVKLLDAIREELPWYKRQHQPSIIQLCETAFASLPE